MAKVVELPSTVGAFNKAQSASRARESSLTTDPTIFVLPDGQFIEAHFKDGSLVRMDGFDANGNSIPVRFRRVAEGSIGTETARLKVACWACIEDEQGQQSVCIGITCPETIE